MHRTLLPAPLPSTACTAPCFLHLCTLNPCPARWFLHLCTLNPCPARWFLHWDLAIHGPLESFQPLRLWCSPTFRKSVHRPCRCFHTSSGRSRATPFGDHQPCRLCIGSVPDLVPNKIYPLSKCHSTLRGLPPVGACRGLHRPRRGGQPDRLVARPLKSRLTGR